MNEDIRIDVLRIADIFFAVHEELWDSTQPNYKYQIEHQVGFSVKSNLINFKFRIFYTYVGKEDRLLDILVDNVFQIENLEKYVSVSDESIVTTVNMNLPSDVLIRMTEMCISHTRALLAKNKAGTNFYNVHPPYLDAKIIAKHFFKDKITD